eukprot:Amastigsp_a844132_6.p2 type:complete len:214 gc:universal Amastigsp_a844132_6:742-101(-)
MRRVGVLEPVDVDLPRGHHGPRPSEQLEGVLSRRGQPGKHRVDKPLVALLEPRSVFARGVEHGASAQELELSRRHERGRREPIRKQRDVIRIGRAGALKSLVHQKNSQKNRNVSAENILGALGQGRCPRFHDGAAVDAFFPRNGDVNIAGTKPFGGKGADAHVGGGFEPNTPLGHLPRRRNILLESSHLDLQLVARLVTPRDDERRLFRIRTL